MATVAFANSTSSKGDSIACSICAAAFVDQGTGGENSHNAATASQPSRQNNRPHARANNYFPSSRIGLDASFVNIPHSSHLQPDGNSNGGVNSNLEGNVHDIESILDDALRSSQITGTGGRSRKGKDIINGADMHDASRRMDAFLENAMALLSEGSSSIEGGGASCDAFYCQSCLDRIANAIETCSERLDEECTAYDEAASSEEERTSLLSKVISMNSDMNGGLDVHYGDDDDGDDAAIHRAIESFQYELDNLANACDEQVRELRTLQTLMQDQTIRSNAISEQEDVVHHELNALEIDARNFGEESHLVSNSCSAVENEIDAMSRVKLMSIPFTIQANWNPDIDNAHNQNPAGHYPTINNLRLAYRTNETAGLHRDEINAAFSNAAQLVAFTLGLYPNLITSTSNIVRIIPIHPCAKILVNLSEGQSVHNLGFDGGDDGGDGDGESNHHVPTKSITLFLVLLSQISSHIVAETDRDASGSGVAMDPPFHMTEFSIDNVDLTKLADSNTAAWSSVVFCIAANLRWLSEIEIGQFCV